VGKGWKKFVPSSKPIEIIEADIIKKMVDDDVLVITCGGGEIPVIKNGGRFEGAEAVIEKNLVSTKLASTVEADYLVFLTKVTHAYINYNTPKQKRIEQIDLLSINTLKEEGHFARGTMLPKIEAAEDFIRSNPKGKAIITSLDNIGNIFSSNPGTLITA
jgi:carbamate kinase